MTIFLFLWMIVNFGQRTHYVLGLAPDTGNSWNNYKPFIKCKGPITLFILSPWSSAIRKIDTRTGDMDKLPDEILLRIFSFIHFTERIILRTVCWRWSSLLYDPSLLENISITRSYCTDHQLASLFAASKSLIAVDFFNSRSLNGSCILLAGLSRLTHLTLTAPGITDRILSCILQASSELVELHLTGTQISELCVPDIIGLGKLRYFAFPPEDVCRFSKRGVLAIVKGCPALRTLDCQEGYFFVLWQRGDHKDCKQQLPTHRFNHPTRIYWWQHVYVCHWKLKELESYLCVRDKRYTSKHGQSEKQEAVFRHLLEGEPFTVTAEL